MDLHFAVFPKPKAATYNDYNPNLIWIPRTALTTAHVEVPNIQLSPVENIRTGQQNTFSVVHRQYIPCMFFPCNTPTDRIMMYFHGNSEDVGSSEMFFFPLKDTWKVGAHNIGTCASDGVRHLWSVYRLPSPKRGYY